MLQSNLWYAGYCQGVGDVLIFSLVASAFRAQDVLDYGYDHATTQLPLKCQQHCNI